MSKSARFAVEFDTMAKPKKNVESDSQSDVFIDAARSLGCDESEERFDAALKKIARHKPPDKKPDHTEETDKPAK
jgi:hypothetical protein